jgi:hypothetical protein
MACIDFNRTYLQRQHGDLLAIYTWFDGERALVIIPAARARPRWFVVCESAAWQYDDPRYLARKCAEACRYLGLSEDKATWVRLATIVNEGLPDLVLMPSEPEWEVEKAREYGVLTAKADGQVMRQEALTIAAQAGAEYVLA